ncbi:MAG: hypothetical protein PHS96_06045 [Anaerolineales bacterium]|nr:hypothetical protein [Anaerolineales bacterium]MDD5467347.1 hypothetical protein [Anaerolineales bacterium]
MASEAEVKPLKWKPGPNIGYTVHRRPDGGMHYVFTDLSEATLKHWREFSLEHLLESDRLTRNLYDLRQIAQVPAEAVQYAVELGNDPSVRNIRLAVVVANEAVRQAIEEIDALTPPGNLEVGIFTDLVEAEAWLNRPLTLLV